MKTISFILLFIFSASAFSAYTPLSRLELRNEAVTRLVQGVGTPAAVPRAAVSTPAGRYAVATMLPSSATGLARMLARSSPYALAGLAAMDYFQDENGDFTKEPEKDVDEAVDDGTLVGSPPLYETE